MQSVSSQITSQDYGGDSEKRAYPQAILKNKSIIKLQWNKLKIAVAVATKILRLALLVVRLGTR
jgi:hypothetical protein